MIGTSLDTTEVGDGARVSFIGVFDVGTIVENVVIELDDDPHSLAPQYTPIPVAALNRMIKMAIPSPHLTFFLDKYRECVGVGGSCCCDSNTSFSATRTEYTATA